MDEHKKMSLDSFQHKGTVHQTATIFIPLATKIILQLQELWEVIWISAMS